MQKLGQHFLKNETAIRNIVAALELRAGNLIVEIGPGKGSLTFPLALACERSGAKLIAIEKDKRLVDQLLSQSVSQNIKMVQGDALKELPELISRLTDQPTNYKIVGNIPYYITGKLLRVISELEKKPERTVLMIQKEVAQRICAQPPEMNLLAAAVQFWAEPKILFSLKPKEFTPPPKVDSAVITLILKSQDYVITPLRYYAFIRIVFKQPRKTIGNNLSAGFEELSRADIEKKLNKIGLNPSLRPQNLSLQQLIQLAQIF